MQVLTSFNGYHYKVVIAVNGKPVSGLVTANQEKFTNFVNRAKQNYDGNHKQTPAG